MGLPRDPVSEAFDAAARRLLSRAYAARGEWVTVWLPDPTIRQRSRFTALGIGDLTGPDRPSVAAGTNGGLNARTRWARGFVRALNYQHKWYSPARTGPWRTQRRTVARSTGGLKVEVGRLVAASPQFNPADPGAGGLPPRRRIRIRLESGGAAKQRAVARLPDRDRIFTDNGTPGGRWSNPALRDWG
jgi:hypothetical protein